MAKEKQTFEQAMDNLEGIVERIESGRIGLAESIAEYEKGVKLIKQCRTILEAAEKKIQLLARGEDDKLEPDGELKEETD